MFDKHMKPKSAMSPEEAYEAAYAEAYAQGLAEGYASVQEIYELCAVRGDFDAAGAFLRARASVADVKAYFGMTLTAKERQVLITASNPLKVDLERRLALAADADHLGAAASTENPLLADANRRSKAVN